jgi:adenosylcobinamide-GDP ribazoletransferase
VFVTLALVLPGLLAAVLAVSAGAVLTGAFHEDGLGDVADAFAGAWSIERRLEILEDPRHGTFGVLAITAALVARVAAISGLGTWEAVALLPAAHAISRVPAVVLMRRLTVARRDGLAASLARGLTGAHEAVAVMVGSGLVALLIGAWALQVLVICAVVSGAMGALARRKIGGISGDVLGATQQLVEVAVLALGAAVVHEAWGRLAWWGP